MIEYDNFCHPRRVSVCGRTVNGFVALRIANFAD